MGDRTGTSQAGLSAGELRQPAHPPGPPLLVLLVESHPLATSASTPEGLPDKGGGSILNDRVYGQQRASGTLG